MPFFKTLHTTVFALICMSLICITLATSATAQSTHDHDHDHDHDDHSASESSEQISPLPAMVGAFSQLDSDHVLGSPVAPVSMIIYASVTCPHCSSWFTSIWPDIKKNYIETNKLSVVFREFPTQPANIAVIGFQIANCAPEDQYFSIIEHQMIEQSNIFASLNAGTGKDTYLAIAKKAGLADEAAMNTCIQSQAGYDRINKSMSLAGAAGIKSVPHFIINGEIYKGGQDFLPLAKHLDEAINLGYSPVLQ